MRCGGVECLKARDRYSGAETKKSEIQTKIISLEQSGTIFRALTTIFVSQIFSILEVVRKLVPLVEALPRRLEVLQNNVVVKNFNLTFFVQFPLAMKWHQKS